MTAAVSYPALLRPRSYAEAATQLAEYDGEARVLGGGQSLSILMRLGLAQPPALVSLARCPGAQTVSVDEGEIRLGPRFTVGRAADELVRTNAPAVSDAAAQVASPHVRNAGTVVGNVCHADPGNDMAVPLLCHDAAVLVRSVEGGRRVPLGALLVGPYQLSLDASEFVEALLVPELSGWLGSYRKVVWRGADHPVAGAAVAVRLDGDRVAEVRIALGGAVIVPSRLRAVERALVGCSIREVHDVLRAAVPEELAGLDFLDDPEVPADYLRKASQVVVGDAWSAALGEREERISDGD